MENQTSNQNTVPFLKMHGLGNDFVILDARAFDIDVSDSLARAVGDRHFGVGFDQLALLKAEPGCDVAVTFWNTDGSLSAACGNATRCIARLLFDETGKTEVIIRTGRGYLTAVDAGDGLVSVNMGQPQFDWRDVPLAEDVDMINLPMEGAPAALGMGNPHCAFIVDDINLVNLEEQGTLIEHHHLYPERTNVEFIQVLAPDRIRIRIWERGAGVTWASGSGSCAAAVAAHRKGLTERKVTVVVDGGEVMIDWREDGVWMTGPTKLVFRGVLSTEFLADLK